MGYCGIGLQPLNENGSQLEIGEIMQTMEQWEESLNTHTQEVYINVGDWFKQAKELLDDCDEFKGKKYNIKDLIEIAKMIQMEYWQTAKIYKPK
jgi:hypothetical protein